MQHLWSAGSVDNFIVGVINTHAKIGFAAISPAIHHVRFIKSPYLQKCIAPDSHATRPDMVDLVIAPEWEVVKFCADKPPAVNISSRIASGVFSTLQSTTAVLPAQSLRLARAHPGNIHSVAELRGVRLLRSAVR